jgi:hypothetical protein
LANAFASAYVSHSLADHFAPVVPPALATIFVVIFFAVWPIHLSLGGRLRNAVRYWLWATAVYEACLPVCAWEFVRHLFKEPIFERTPKGLVQSPTHRVAASITVGVGVVAILWSIHWWSPFSPMLLSFGIAWLSFPLYGWLNKTGVQGALARSLVIFPGMFLTVALFAICMWAVHLV